jgi:shikimate kinase
VRNIYLIGFIGSGTRKHAGRIAAEWNLEHIDTDAFIEEQEGMRVQDIFRTKGESYFRRIEEQLLLDIAARENLIVSFGVGTPCVGDNMEIMRRSGLIVYLRAGVGCVMKAVMAMRKRGEMFTEMEVAEVSDFLMEKLDERRPCYETAAQITLRARGLDTKVLMEEIEGGGNG